MNCDFYVFSVYEVVLFCVESFVKLNFFWSFFDWFFFLIFNFFIVNYMFFIIC